MKLAVLHLSDIHFEITSNDVSNRVAAVASAVVNVDNSFDSLLIVISGDIANTGHHDEYEHALVFVQDLIRHVRAAVGDAVEIQVATVPGNHDIDLSILGDETIGVLASNVLRDEKQPSTSESLYRTLLSSQANYREFDRELTRRAQGELHEWIDNSFVIRVGTSSVKIRCLNTAILSRYHERQGELWFPLELFDKSPSLRDANDFCVCIYHHPDKWLESNNAGKFRTQTENTADLVLMGHQHTPDSYYGESLSHNRTWYSAGDILQKDKESQSGFAVIYLDFALRLRRLASYSWNGNLYLLKQDTDWQSFTENSQARSGYVLTKTFSDSLADPGSLIVHTQKKTVLLRDIYEPCRLRIKGNSLAKENSTIAAQEIPEFLNNKSKLIIFGETQSGKSTLAKRLFSDLFASDGSLVPIFINAVDLRSASDRDVIGGSRKVLNTNSPCLLISLSKHRRRSIKP